MAAKIKDQDLEISRLKVRVQSLEDKERRSAAPTQEDAPITRGIMEIGEELGTEKSTELGSNDIEEMVNVLSLMEAANILTSGVAAASVSPAEVLLVVGVPTISGSFPTVSAIFTTASVIDAQVAREMEEEFTREKQRESEQLAGDFEITRLHAEEKLKMMIEGLDRSNKVIAKHLQECEQAAADLSIGEKLELISELVKYQDHRAKKQLEDFMPMSLKEEGERVKRQGLKIDQGSSKRMKTSEDVSEEELKGMMQLVPLEEIYVKALQFDREDLHQLWTLVKETFSIRQATKDKEKELWEELKRLFELDIEDQLWTHNQAFMFPLLSERDAPAEEVCNADEVKTLVRETLSIRQAKSDKEKELWVELKRLYEPDVEDQLWTHTQTLMHDPVEWRLYDTCGVHHVLSRDQ
nr:hypothetical protein [Tanacetum cinerariifolium]